MSTEALIAADPEVILLGDGAYGVTAETVAARPGWSVLRAVKDGAIAAVDDIVVTRPGPRLVEGLSVLVGAIHPGVLPSLAPVAP
jgi:iron complex transport system substrate-binding protein